MRSTIFVINGDKAIRTRPDTIPAIIAVLVSVSPTSFASCRRSAPRRFPTMILPAFPSPRQKHTTRFLEIFAIPLAATASVPRCPMITEYMEKPIPHARLLINNGTAFCQKRPNNFFSQLLRLNFTALILHNT